MMKATSLMISRCNARYNTHPLTRARGIFIFLAITAILLGGWTQEKHKKPPRNQNNLSPDQSSPDEWPAYGHDPGGSRYSPLDEINRENVKELKVAWAYRTGDVSDGSKTAETSQFESTPIMVNGTLFLSTPFNRVIALDAETGAERWTYDPRIDITAPYGDGLTCRGVSTWLDRKRGIRQSCRRRIFLATNDGRLIALDAATGTPCDDFGKGGQVELTRGVGEFRPGEYHMTSPPAVISGLVIVGSAITDNEHSDAPRGVVRAFDARTGKLRWSWDPIPTHSKDRAWETWGKNSASRTGAANVWSIISVDPYRGLVFLPTSSPSPDFYGGERPGDNLYADSVVALRATTGKLVWHFQLVHHDVWDYDVPAQPVLITIHHKGKATPALAVVTKMGTIFLLHRETGKPLFSVAERPAPQNGVPGETLSPTQPLPEFPPPLGPQKLRPEDAWGITAADRDYCRERIKQLRSDGIFTPPTLEGSIIFPGNIGGAHWGGASFDPNRKILIVNTNRFPFVVTLIPRDRYEAERQAHPDADISPQTGTAYAVRRDVLRAASGVLCNQPPWGTLAAIDFRNEKLRWEVPLGTIPRMAQMPGSHGWGSPNLGGSIITAGGLVFIAAAMDNYLRAFDIETGEELWKGALPASAQATPMTYRIAKNGKQYVVIAAGGHGRLGTKLGDYVVAFTLP